LAKVELRNRILAACGGRDISVGDIKTFVVVETPFTGCPVAAIRGPYIFE
jgi:hypothetical protein